MAYYTRPDGEIEVVGMLLFDIDLPWVTRRSAMADANRERVRAAAERAIPVSATLTDVRPNDGVTTPGEHPTRKDTE